MIYISIVLTFLAAILALIARLKSKALIPSYRVDFHQVHHIFDQLIGSNKLLIEYLKKDVETNGGISGDKENPSLGLINALNNVEKGITNSEKRLKESKLVDATKDANHVGTVRLYQLSSFMSAALAFIIQIINVLKDTSL